MTLLLGVRTEIWFIKDELKTIQAFLVTAESVKKKDMLLRVWVEQVRDMSYDIEDCLNEFMVHVGSQSLLRQLLKFKDRHKIAIQIRSLKARVEEVSNRNIRYRLIKKELLSTSDERNSFIEDIRNQSAMNIDEAELVGFSKPRDELIKLINVHAMNAHPQVVCVVGMGGLGKTTVIKMVYERIKGFSCRESIKSFSCCAWIVVSQSFDRMELLKLMIKELLGEEALKNNFEGKLVRDLVEYLSEKLREKRYFVVLDDIWNLNHWLWIKNIFSKNTKGSWIIVTTRDDSLAKKVCTDESLIYHLQPLQIDDAIKLLLRKIRKREEDMKNDEKMKIIVTKIVKKCGCLPLAILTIGGMLATKMVTNWESIYNQLPSELESNPTLEAVRRIVTLSYNHLPSHLKPCFLYLSIFPEDYEISKKCLINRWIAEGFVKARVGMTVKDVGESYFNELLNQNMIQSSRVNIEGTIKRCRVHDIMRDITLSISREGSFACLIRDNTTSAAEESFRHVAYHDSGSSKISMDWSHVRSVTVFGKRPMEPRPSLSSPKLRMLRVLDLQNPCVTTQKDINIIGSLFHLRYVNVQGNSSIYALPGSIGKLQGLGSLCIVNVVRS